MPPIAASDDTPSSTLLLDPVAVPATGLQRPAASATAALTILHRQHQEILTHIQQIRLLANLPDAGRPLHLSLLHLRASVSQHLACEDNLLYAVLRHHAHPQVRLLMGACSEAVRDQAAAFGLFTRRWLGQDQTMAYPLGFCHALDRITETIRERIRHEEQDVYPFIAKHL